MSQAGLSYQFGKPLNNLMWLMQGGYNKQPNTRTVDQPNVNMTAFANALKNYQVRSGKSAGTFTGNPSEFDPGTIDVAAALQGDYSRAEQLDQQNYQRRSRSLQLLQGVSDKSREQARQDANQMVDEGNATADQFVSSVAGQAQTAASAALGQYNQSLTDLDKTEQNVAGMGAKALADFQDQSAAKMSEWTAGHDQQVKQQKQAEAARLQQQGASPDEIQNAMKRIDYQASVDRATQSAQFQEQDQTAKTQLRAQYDTMSANASTAIAQLRAGTRDAIANVGKWQQGVNQSAQLSAMESKGNYQTARQQARMAADSLQMSGYGQWATLTQDNDETFTPYSSVLQSILGTNLMLEGSQLRL